LAGLAASAEQAAALPPGEPVARDATVVPRLEAAARDATVVPQQEAAWDAAVGPQQEAEAWVGAEEPQQEAVAPVEAAVPRQEAEASVEAAVPREARGAAEVLLQAAAPDVRVVQRRAALPSAALWVFHRGQLRRPARPAPQPAAQFVRAMERLRIASR
jgi:hypothetical protein